MAAEFRFKGALFALLQASLSASVLAQVSVPDDVVAKALRNFQIPTAPAAKSSDNAPISPALLDLADQAASKNWSSEAGRSSKNGVVLDAGLANVVIKPLPGRTSDLKAKLVQLGGSVQIEQDDRVYARLAPQQFHTLMASGLVKSMAPQSEHRSRTPSGGRTGMVGEGISLARIEALHRAGFTGRGIKVGVLDLGFHRYDELVKKGELPEPENFMVFSQHQGFGPQVHGTACAEIVHDVAPDAKLVIAQAGPGLENAGATEAEIMEAARWLESQGVDIISASFGGYGSAIDGSDGEDRMVDAMTERGRLWVIAAGNEGGVHWAADIRDANGDGRVDIPGSPVGDALLINKLRPGPLSIFLKWSDWEGQARAGDPQDLDMIVLRVNPDGRATQVAERRRPRASTDIPPSEYIEVDADAGVYALMLLPSRITRSVKTHVYVEGASLVNRNPSGSVSSPGSARLALTVGAVHAKTGKLEDYSSQGPTDDGRTKPEVVAPSSVSSVAYGHTYSGTSAATPHVAGFAALLKQANPQLSALQLRQKVIETVTSLEPDTPNNRTGYGLIDGTRLAGGGAGAPAPAPAAVAPGTGSAGQLLAPIQDMLRKR